MLSNVLLSWDVWMAKTFQSEGKSRKFAVGICS